MVEVALFADILTLKEALEFAAIRGEDISSRAAAAHVDRMLKKVYRELMPTCGRGVAMVAAGRTIKQLHPDALTVFVGPCVAKKAEAREPDLKGAIDFVLTFREVRDIFEAADIRPEELEEDGRDHSSRAGRIYARAGGVSDAVRMTVEQLNPGRPIRIRTEVASGIPVPA